MAKNTNNSKKGIKPATDKKKRDKNKKSEADRSEEVEAKSIVAEDAVEDNCDRVLIRSLHRFCTHFSASLCEHGPPSGLQ